MYQIDDYNLNKI